MASSFAKSNDFLETPDAFERFVARWRSGELPRENWTHAAHVAVAAYHAFHDADTTLVAMREGIIHFNRCTGTENTETSGYHETMTRFWCDAVCALVAAGSYDSAWDAARAAVTAYGTDRDLVRRAYDHDVVADRVARRSWVPPVRPLFPRK